MRAEELKLNLVVYRARVIDVGIDRVDERMVVEEFKVTKAGKEFFELRSNRARLAGAYRNMGETLMRMELSPTAAIDGLERRIKEAQRLNEDRYARKVIELDSRLRLVQDWKKEHGP